MPKLPDSTSLGNRPVAQPTTGVVSYTPTTGMEGATAQSLMSVGNDMTQLSGVFEQETQRIDTLRAEDAYNQLSAKRLDLTYSQDNGFKNKKGADAVTTPLLQNYTEQFKQAADSISEGLGNDQQKELFKRRAGVANVQYQQDILQHLSTESDVYRNQVLKTAMSTSQQESAANPTTVPANLVRLNALIDQQPGLDDATKNEAKLEASSGIHTAVLNELLSQNQSSQARAYFAEHQSEIDPTHWDNIRKSMEQVSVKNDSLVLSQQLTQVGGLQAQIKTLNQQFNDGKISAEVVDATRTRLEHNWQMNKAQQAEGEKSIMGAAQDYLLKNPDATINDLPLNLYNGLKNTGNLSTINAFAKSGRFDNDPQAWLEFTSMPKAEIANMTADELYTKYRGKFDDAHLEKAGAMLQAAQDPEAAKHAGIVTVNEAVKRGAQDAGIIPWNGKPNDKQAQAYAAYETEIDQRTKAYEQSTLGGKRAANAEEVKKITDDVLMNKVYTPGFFSDTQKPTFQLQPSEIKDAYVKVGNEEVKLTSVPATQRAQIIGELRRRGRPVTEQAVAEYWIKGGRQE